MDSLYWLFPISGVKTYIFIPPVVAFVVSFFTSMGGLSGAFLLLPFQISFLNFTAPSVSATNFVYNIVATPSGIYRYLKEGRMAWPLTWVIIAGTLPGVLVGYFLRVRYLPDPRAFKLFVGCILLYLGLRLLYEMTSRSPKDNNELQTLEDKFNQYRKASKENQTRQISSGLPVEAVVKTVGFSLSRVEYEFWGERFSFSTPAMFFLACVVGVIGGAYGIGGGAIIAPFCVAVFHLPVYSVAGAALLGTFFTSIAGVFFYSIIPTKAGIATAPDLMLGFLFGAGGFIGTYFGARAQKFFPQKFIKLILSLVISFLALFYIRQYFQ